MELIVMLASILAAAAATVGSLRAERRSTAVDRHPSIEGRG